MYKIESIIRGCKGDIDGIRVSNMNTSVKSTISIGKDGLTLINVDKTVKEYEVPSFIRHIATDTFKNCKKLERVIVNSNILTIGNYAFEGCVNLREIIIDCEISEIQTGTFSGCTSLRHVKLSRTIRFIGSLAFNNCVSLESLDTDIPANNIDTDAFKGCSSLGLYGIYKVMRI